MTQLDAPCGGHVLLDTQRFYRGRSGGALERSACVAALAALNVAAELARPADERILHVLPRGHVRARLRAKLVARCRRLCGDACAEASADSPDLAHSPDIAHSLDIALAADGVDAAEAHVLWSASAPSTDADACAVLRAWELWDARDPDASPFVADRNYAWLLEADAGAPVRHYVGAASALARDRQKALDSGRGGIAHRTWVHARAARGDRVIRTTATMEAFLFDPGTRWRPPAAGAELGALVFPLRRIELASDSPLRAHIPTRESRPRLFARYKSEAYPYCLYEEHLYQEGFVAAGERGASRVRATDEARGGLNRHIDTSFGRFPTGDTPSAIHSNRMPRSTAYP